MSKPIFLSSNNQYSRLKEVLSSFNPRQIAVLADQNTFALCWPKVRDSFPNISEENIIVIPAGEAHKTVETAAQIWTKLAQLNMGREGVLVNIGGGVVTDLGGFCASTYKRGIAFYNMPTSLLAMVDAAIGGKTGVDVQGVKNLAGTFKVADELIILPEFLETLPQQECLSGFAEVLKHGLIADAAYWQNAQLAWENGNYADLIHRSVEIKNAVVAQDEKESGLRKTLNFGHTLGHAVESFFLQKKKPILHGFAVAAGMLMAAKLSAEKSSLPINQWNKIVRVLQAYFPKLTWNADDEDAILSWLNFDKKNVNGQPRFVLLQDIGKPEFDIEVPLLVVKNALNWYRNLPEK